ncbi:hypothetical protein FOVG_15685 [Fusarium oxysporum f. sp. pisi HDV247]|uniref:Uncharacterized protein n=1 Tax=Fusarium oxysporum f. sp. pisi HDV247 TaxID=1080344 RepID=W9NZA9_FUSOX|nr:hypothetical protein FOVG_15685 [Fusarium oxysporum f. sp. pisi HDV247]
MLSVLSPNLHGPLAVNRYGFYPSKRAPNAGLNHMSDGQHVAAGGNSGQRKRPDDSKTPDKIGKRQRQGKSPGEKASNDDGDGKGSGSGRGFGCDGPRYPQLDSPLPRAFECPFHKFDPARYPNCKKLHIRRIADVTQHIERHHLLKVISINTMEKAEPKDFTWYCARCRNQFWGLDAEEKLEDHMLACSIARVATIAKTGVFLPGEFERLKSEVRSTSGEVEKWNVIWRNCFPETEIPASPYVEIAVPRQQAERILQHLQESSLNPLLSAEDRQSEVNKALDAIYSRPLFLETENRINDASANLFTPPQTTGLPFVYQQAYHQNSLSFEASTYSPLATSDMALTMQEVGKDPYPTSYLWADPIATLPFQGEAFKSFDEPFMIQQSTNPRTVAEDFRMAVFKADHDNVHDILKSSFTEVAIGEYSWLLELKVLGLSIDEIANKLLEESRDRPWIYSKIKVANVEPFYHDFHIPRCAHSRNGNDWMPRLSSQPTKDLKILESKSEAESEPSIRSTIEYLTGIGGVSPMPDGTRSLQFGSVAFEDDNSAAIVSFTSTESFQAIPHVLQHLEKAIGTLQQVGGCCDSFTFLIEQEGLVEVDRIDLANLKAFAELRSATTSSINIQQIPLGSLTSRIHSDIKPEASEDLDPLFLEALTAQFLSLAFALYSQGHCEPFRPFFLDTALKRILLIGNQKWSSDFTGPCILACPAKLSCFGKMLQRRVFAFKYFEAFERSKVLYSPSTQLHLKASPEDLLDTWGPGDLVLHNDDPENLHAISIGGGLIMSTSKESEAQLPVLHWSSNQELDPTSTPVFPRNAKMVIGSRVFVNQSCRVTAEKQIELAARYLVNLGTFPSYWEPSERQLGVGIQGGQSAVGILSFAQTWVKKRGMTRKSLILAQRPLFISDLEGPYAVQISFCTGIARRVRLRELLADILPVYVKNLAATPLHWDELIGDSEILQILRDDNFTVRYQGLSRDLQAEFESLAFAVLSLFRDTGVDKDRENLVIGCIRPKIAAQCFKIPLKKESLWAQMVADSENVATFAYAATRCFETGRVKCRGPIEHWDNKTALFWTDVSLCRGELVDEAVMQHQTQWKLRDSEAYLIRLDEPLLARVLPPDVQNEPDLLVSKSTIPASFLIRLNGKVGLKKPWIRESTDIDYLHQKAESVVVAAEFES